MAEIRKVASLVRVMLRTFSFNIAFASSRGKKERKAVSAVLLIVVLAVSLGPLAYAAGYMILNAYDALSVLGIESLILEGFTSIAAMVIFLFGIANVMAVFYYARDTERYLALPVKPTTILSAKLITTVIYEYIVCALMVLPVYILYGVRSGAGAVFYLYSVAGCLLLPVIPIALAGAPVMLLMRFTRIFRNRDVVNMLFMLLLLTAIMFFQLSFNNLLIMSGSESEMIRVLTDKLASLSGGVGQVFIGAGFLSAALRDAAQIKGLLYMLAFVAATAVVYALFLALGRAVYFRGVLGLGQTATGKKTTLAQVGNMTRGRGAMASIMVKDMRVMLRTPVYFLNNVFMIFFLPIFMVVLFTMQGVSSDPDMAALRAMLEGLTFSLHVPASSLALYGAMAAGALMGSMNCIAGSALSREGRQFNLMKILPVSYETQIAAKTGLGYLASIASGLLTMAIVAVFIKIPPLFSALMLIPMLLGALVPNLAGILAELYMPKLHWTNEQTAVKQNLNVLLEILAGFVVTAVVIGGGIWLTNSLGLMPLAALGVCVAAGAVLNLALYAAVRRAIPVQMNKLYAS
ncbi:MAG: putative ABC transporter permease subunit [Christensenellales bacterium]|jgi:ABC-2 type transport system permease protein